MLFLFCLLKCSLSKKITFLFTDTQRGFVHPHGGRDLTNERLDWKHLGHAAELILMEPGRGLRQGELADPDPLQLAWAALLRMLEKTAPGFRD